MWSKPWDAHWAGPFIKLLIRSSGWPHNINVTHLCLHFLTFSGNCNLHKRSCWFSRSKGKRKSKYFRTQDIIRSVLHFQEYCLIKCPWFLLVFMVRWNSHWKVDFEGKILCIFFQIVRKARVTKPGTRVQMIYCFSRSNLHG